MGQRFRVFFHFLALSLMLSNCSATKPDDLGCTDGRLSPCPDSPNCVSSQSSDKAHYIEPLTYRGTLTEARKALVSVIARWPHSEIVQATDDYVRAEFTSRFFGFVDDVEFCMDDDLNMIHVRSSSRVGYFDFGVNRKRIERLRAKFAAPRTED
ncbi:MAG: DUF1499 domain-containing protein [Thermodesulfobacteriota bacterium]|nr:DUF1499 domain-containing protein [Thermodesulfobacteriota bacterium]